MWVIDSEGTRGRIDPGVSPVEGHVAVKLDGNRQILVPAAELRRRDEHSYELPVSFQEYTDGADEGTVTVPVIEEQLTVRKRPTEGGVRIEKRVREREAVVNVPVFKEEVRVERVPVGREIRRPVATHYEGETLIVPVMEEVLVTEKRLVLREVLRISKRKVQKSEPRRITLRREEAIPKPIEAKDEQGK